MDQKAFEALGDDTLVEVSGKPMTKREVMQRVKALRDTAAAQKRAARANDDDPTAALERREKAAVDSANAPIVAQMKTIRPTITVAPSGAAPSPAPSGSAPPAGSAPALNAMLGQLKPGSAVILGGANFGAAEGEVRMYGTFDGGFVKLSVDSWGPKGIGAFVPAIKGVLDQEVSIKVVRKDGSASNVRKSNFTAAREVRKLKLSDFGTGSCTNALHSTDSCKTSGQSDCGASVCADHWLGVFGTWAKSTDRYAVTLKNGWTYESHSFKGEAVFEPPPWEWANPILLLEYGLAPNPKPTLNVAAKGSSPLLDVSWHVLYMWANRYDLDVYVTGPAGTAHK